MRLRQIHIEILDEWMILNFKTSMHIPDFSCSILTHESPWTQFLNSSLETFEIKYTARLSSPIHRGLASRSNTQGA
jgi:hypothetical protein